MFLAMKFASLTSTKVNKKYVLIKNMVRSQDFVDSDALVFIMQII